LHNVHNNVANKINASYRNNQRKIMFIANILRSFYKKTFNN